MPTTFENLGVKASVTNDKLKIEVSIKGLVNGFNQSPNNYDEAKVKRGCRKDFAEYVAKALVDGSNPDTGDNPIMEALEGIFEEILESAEEFVKYPNEDED